MEKAISNAVIRRLPRYYRYLNILIDEGIDRISSANLSRRMDVTASQIRQDFNHFGGFGQQGYGYNVKHLKQEIGKVLGLDKGHSMACVGIGNIGKALVRSASFQQNGFYVEQIFDSSPEKIGQVVNDMVIKDANDLVSCLKANPVDIVILTVPKEAAPAMAEKVVEAGVKAIWNFAYCELALPNDIAVENVYLVDSLMRLSYRDSHRPSR